MTEKQLNLIYDYMGWDKYVRSNILDSNDAWECVQEMEKKEDWGEFIDDVYRDFYRWIDRIRRGIKGQQVTEIDSPIETQFPKYIINPTNFFKCMAAWLEQLSGNSDYLQRQRNQCSMEKG